MNDGQDCEDLKVDAIMSQWLWFNPNEPFGWVGVHAGDRMQEYGVVNRPDCHSRGSKANLYQQFLLEELLPHLAASLPINLSHPENALIGFSLGGLSAFDLSWRNAKVFPVSGAFSASFWWRSKDVNKGYTDADRIIHQMVRTTRRPENWRVYMQAGSHDEHSDRNGNGIIDAIEDTLDLMKELRKHGFNRPDELRFVLAKEGFHNQHTWSQVLPDFLYWWLKYPGRN
jgi:predicted alpha/beta superfamily hydrolase